MEGAEGGGDGGGQRGWRGAEGAGRQHSQRPPSCEPVCARQAASTRPPSESRAERSPSSHSLRSHVPGGGRTPERSPHRPLPPARGPPRAPCRLRARKTPPSPFLGEGQPARASGHCPLCTRCPGPASLPRAPGRVSGRGGLGSGRCRRTGTPMSGTCHHQAPCGPAHGQRVLNRRSVRLSPGAPWPALALRRLSGRRQGGAGRGGEGGWLRGRAAASGRGGSVPEHREPRARGPGQWGRGGPLPRASPLP